MKVLHTAGRFQLCREIVLTFIDAASAANFAGPDACSPALTWPGPVSGAGPPLERFLLADMPQLIQTLRKQSFALPDAAAGVPADQQVVVLLPTEDCQEAKTRVVAVSQAWSAVKQVHHQELTDAQLAYGKTLQRAGRTTWWRPAAVVTFESGEAAALAAGKLCADDHHTLVVLCSDFLTCAAKPEEKPDDEVANDLPRAERLQKNLAKGVKVQENEHEILYLTPAFTKNPWNKAAEKLKSAAAAALSVATLTAAVKEPKVKGKKKFQSIENELAKKVGDPKKIPLATVVVCCLKNRPGVFPRHWQTTDAKALFR